MYLLYYYTVYYITYISEIDCIIIYIKCNDSCIPQLLNLNNHNRLLILIELSDYSFSTDLHSEETFYAGLN